LSWNLKFAMRFDEQFDYGVLFSELVGKIIANAIFGEFLQISIYKDSPISTNLETRYTNKSDQFEDINIGQIWEQREEKSGNLILEGMWQTARYVPKDWKRKPKKFEPILGSSIVSVATVGNEVSWQEYLRQKQLNVVYDVGDFKDFDPNSRGDLGKANLGLLLNELHQFIELGALEIRGMGAEHYGGIPQSCCLCFHDNIDGYLADLNIPEMAKFLPAEFSQEQFETLLVETPTIDFFETSKGVIVYAKKFPFGNLSEFYQKIELTIRHG
jgi:hypothetical protein